MSIHWRSKLLVWAVSLTVALVALVMAQVALGQSADCGGHTCIDQQPFDTEASTLGDAPGSGWSDSPDAPYDPAITTTLQWIANKTFGFLIWQTSADGVLVVNGRTVGLEGIRKTLYLDPGYYQMQLRAGSSDGLGSNIFMIVYLPDDQRLDIGSCNVSGFEICESSTFTVTTSGMVTLNIDDYGSWENLGATIYLDYIDLAQVAQLPTATPPPAGTPTATPQAANSTPVPTTTPYCVNVPTATPGAPQFAITPTVTATPANAWGLMDKFGYLTLGGGAWTVSGNVSIAQNVGHGLSGNGAVQVPNSHPPDAWDQSTMPLNALIYARPGEFTLPFYLDFWAQASYVPAGVTNTVQVWVLDPTLPYWTLMLEQAVSTSAWYAIHAQVNAPVSNRISAVAITSQRSDGSTAEKVYIDDVYFYGNISMAPRCNGELPPNVSDGANPDSILGTRPDPLIINNGEVIFVPENKPCPTNIDRPNNFWGYLLAGVTLFMDNMFALTPMHTPGQFQGLVKTLILSPIGSLFIYMSILLDWQISFFVLGLMAIIWPIYLIIVIWSMMRRATIQ